MPDGFEFLELAEEILDQVPPFVAVLCPAAGGSARCACGRDHDLRAALVEAGNVGIAVEGLLSEQYVEYDAVDQRIDDVRIETVPGAGRRRTQITRRSVAASMGVMTTKFARPTRSAICVRFVLLPGHRFDTVGVAPLDRRNSPSAD